MKRSSLLRSEMKVFADCGHLVNLERPEAFCSALAGLSALTFRRFLVFVVVGRLPGATLTALLASDVVTRSAVGWIVAGMVLVALVALGFICRKRLEA